MKKIELNLAQRKRGHNFRLPTEGYDIDGVMAVCHSLEWHNILSLDMPMPSKKWTLIHIYSGYSDGRTYATRQEAISAYYQPDWYEKIHSTISRTTFQDVKTLPSYPDVLRQIAEFEGN